MDSFDDIQCEEQAGYEAYQAQLEYQQWLESGVWIDDVNAELRVIAAEEQGVVYECI